MIALQCRPKLLCMLGAVAFAGFLLWELVTWNLGDARLVLAAPYFLGIAAHGLIGQVELVGGRLRERSFYGRWGQPVELAHLTAVSLRRDVKGRSLGLRLEVTDDRGAVSMGLWWWGHWRPLVRAVDQAVVATGLAVDETTERHLARVAGRRPDPARVRAIEIEGPVPADGMAERSVPWRSTVEWRSGIPVQDRVVVVGAWLLALVPFLGPISSGSPETYPALIDLVGISVVLVVLVGVPALAFGVRHALRALLVATLFGLGIGLFDLSYASNVGWMEVLLFAALGALGLRVRSQLPPDVRRVA